MRPRHTSALASALLAVVALAAAGCGGGPKSPSVAALGTSGSGVGASGSAGGGGPSLQSSSGGGQRSGFAIALKAKAGREFSACMRSHGVPKFPDPGANGGLSITSGGGLDPSSPKFQKAMQACQKVLPNGGQPTAQQQAKLQHQMLAFSACMRSHGVPDFPDPTFSAGRASLRITGGKGSNVNPQSPAFQAAQRACGKNLPGKVGSVTASAK